MHIPEGKGHSWLFIIEQGGGVWFNDKGGICGAVLVRVPCNASVIELLDPLGWEGEFFAIGNEEVGDFVVVFIIFFRGGFKGVLEVFDSFLQLVNAVLIL